MTTSTTPKGKQVKPTKSVGAHLRASLKAAQERENLDLKVPDYDELHIIFSPLRDAIEVNSVMEPILAKPETPYRNLELAIAHLVLASADSYAVVDGEKVPLDAPLGLELWEKIFGDDPDATRPENDYQATILLFDENTFVLAQMSHRVVTWSGMVEEESQETALGESKAADMPPAA